MDTRPGQATADGQFAGGGAVGPNGTRAVTIAGRAALSVPANASAVVLNVTAVQPTQAGHLRVWPTGGGLPVVSNAELRRRPDRAQPRGGGRRRQRQREPLQRRAGPEPRRGRRGRLLRAATRGDERVHRGHAGPDPRLAGRHRRVLHTMGSQRDPRGAGAQRGRGAQRRDRGGAQRHRHRAGRERTRHRVPVEPREPTQRVEPQLHAGARPCPTS